MFHFTCFNTEDPHDPDVGLIHGDLAIPGNLLRRDVFDPVVQQVCERTFLEPYVSNRLTIERRSWTSSRNKPRRSISP